MKRSSLPSSEVGAATGAARGAGWRRPAPPPLRSSWGTAPSGRPCAPLACCRKLLESMLLLFVLASSKTAPQTTFSTDLRMYENALLRKAAYVRFRTELRAHFSQKLF